MADNKYLQPNDTTVEGRELPVSAVRAIRRIISRLDDSLYQSEDINSAAIAKLRLRFEAIAKNANTERLETNCRICLAHLIQEINSLVSVM